MPEEKQTSAAALAHDHDERAVTRQVLEEALEMVNSGDTANYDRALFMLMNFVDSTRMAKFAQLPPVAIVGEPSVFRRYLVLEISGGDETTAKSWYGLAELELEHLLEFLEAMLKELPARARKNPPSVVLHKPAAVEA